MSHESIVSNELLQEYRERLTDDRKMDYTGNCFYDELLEYHPWLNESKSYPLILNETFLFIDQYGRLVAHYIILDEMVLIGENIEEGISNYKAKNDKDWPLLDEKGEKIDTYIGRPSLAEIIGAMEFPKTTKEEEREWKKMIDKLKETYTKDSLKGECGEIIWGILTEIELSKGKVIEFSDYYTETLSQNDFKGKTPYQVVVELYNRITS